MSTKLKPNLHKPMGTSEVAALLNWPAWRARRWLKKEGAVVQRASTRAKKRGGHYRTTLAKLMQHFPELGLERQEALQERVGFAAELQAMERRTEAMERRLRALEATLKRMRSDRRKTLRKHRIGRKVQSGETT